VGKCLGDEPDDTPDADASFRCAVRSARPADTTPPMQLEAMTDAEVRAAYNEVAANTFVGLEWYPEELRQRRLDRHTRKLEILTWVLAVLTFANVVGSHLHRLGSLCGLAWLRVRWYGRARGTTRSSSEATRRSGVSVTEPARCGRARADYGERLRRPTKLAGGPSGVSFVLCVAVRSPSWWGRCSQRSPPAVVAARRTPYNRRKPA
jgi:hypothetical protein